MSGELRVIGLICALRAGPQDLPYAPGIALRWVAIGLALDFLVYAQLLELPAASGRLLLSLGLALVTPWLLLQWRRQPQRYAQTLTALAGSGCVMTLCFAPIGWYASDLPPVEGPESVQTAHVLVDLAWLGLTSWNLLIQSAIYKHALELPMRATLALSLGLFVLGLVLDQSIFPADL